jgi:hypothetical protein
MRKSYALVDSVVKAAQPAEVKIRFLFDRDEKSDKELEALTAASKSRAVVLPRREIENYLLCPDWITPVLARRMTDAGAETACTRETVEVKLRDCLASRPDSEREVRGSAVLEQVFWDIGHLSYQKVEDGAAIAAEGMKLAPEAFQELRVTISELFA